MTAMAVYAGAYAMREDWTCPHCGRKSTSRGGKHNHLKHREETGECPPSQNEVRRRTHREAQKRAAAERKAYLTESDTITWSDIDGFWT